MTKMHLAVLGQSLSCCHAGLLPNNLSSIIALFVLVPCRRDPMCKREYKQSCLRQLAFLFEAKVKVLLHRKSSATQGTARVWVIVNSRRWLCESLKSLITANASAHETELGNDHICSQTLLWKASSFSSEHRHAVWDVQKCYRRFM